MNDEKYNDNLDNIEESVQEDNTADKFTSLKLNYPKTLKVGLGFASVMLFWHVYNFVMPLLLEDAFGFSNTVRNIIVGIASALCMLLLPFFGKVSDKCNSKYGKRTPFIVIGSVITILALMFVPLSVNNQIKSSSVIKKDYEYFFNVADSDIAVQYIFDDLSDYGINKGDTVTRHELLGAWYDMAENGDYSMISKATYIDLIDSCESIGVSPKILFRSLYNPNTSNNGLLDLIGATEYYKTEVHCQVVDGNRIYTIFDGETYTASIFDSRDGSTTVIEKSELRDEQPNILDNCTLTKEEYDNLTDEYIKFSAYLSDAVNNFTAKNVQSKVNWGYFTAFLATIIVIILAQTVIRTPAVSLMPDITPSPLRSVGNAMVNLIGGIGGGVGFLIYTTAFLLDIDVTVQYWLIFGVLTVAITVCLLLYILLVRENKWSYECKEVCKELGLPTEEEKSGEHSHKLKDTFKQYKPKQIVGFCLILASVFMWFIGYYAITSNMSIYCVKVLNISAGIASIVSGASYLIAAIGIIPVGFMAKHVGRKISILFGYSMAIISYILVTIFVQRGSDTATVIFMICYMVSGFGLVFANVNALPMVLELSTPKDIGTFTGIYYVATMSAQTLGPVFGGIVMDNLGGSRALFIFSASIVALAIILMCFVKSGEAPDFEMRKQQRKQSKTQKA